MPQINITVTRPEVAVSTTQTGPSVTISETPVEITQNTSTIAITSSPQTVTVNTAATTIQTTTLDEAFKGDYSGSYTYHRGDLVRYEQSVYVYIDETPRTTAAPDVDTDYWVLLFSETGLTGDQVVGINRAINLTTWDPATEYSLGDIVFLRQDYEIDVGVDVPYYTMYRLYHISGSINVNPFTHSYPPSIVDDVVTFDENSAWQNLSGVRSINGFSGDVNLQEILDASSLALNTTTFHQGSEANHGSFEAHADSAYFYGDAVYIGQSTSSSDVGFLLSNQGGAAVVVIDAATGKLKFSNDLTNYYNLPTSTDDIAEGATNKYYTDARVTDYLGSTAITTMDGTTITNGEIRAATGGYAVITDQAEDNYFYVDDNSSQVGAGTHTWQFKNDGTTQLPGYTLAATDGTANQVLTTDGSGNVGFATPSTSNITEGTNKYYTDTRFDDRLATKTTDNVSEGSTNKYYTDTRFDNRLATKTTTNLAEGTNLYYTTSRANSDFDTRLATKSTTNLAEGTNLYYTTARANSDFDTRLATKSTTNLAEGTNQYFTNTRARGAISGSTGISYNNTTGAISIDDTVVATHTYVGTQIANLVDSAPNTLDTLNELAAALGDDPNFATTITTSLGNKLNTADFTSTANTWLATKTTDNVTQGSTNKYFANSLARSAVSVDNGVPTTGAGLFYDQSTGKFTFSMPMTDDVIEGIVNKYYTDDRARSALSGGTGVTYNSSTGQISIGQAVATTSNVTFGSVDSNLTDDNYVLGQVYVTRNSSWTPPPTTLTTISGNNGVVIGSSSGYPPQLGLIHYFGDTSAGTNTSASIATRTAAGTNSSPTAVQSNSVLGNWNFDGYGTTGWATSISTPNQGAGTSSITPLQVQGYARQAFADSGSVSTTVTGASGTGSVATLTFTTQNTAPYVVGQTVTIAGMTPTGYNGTVVLTAATASSISYASTATGFTSGGTITATRTVTQAGTGFRVRGFPNSVVPTVTNRINFMDLTSSAATFKADSYTFADSIVTGATLTSTNLMSLSSSGALFRSAPTTAYASMAPGGSTFTVTGINNFVRTGTTNTTQPAILVRYSRTDTTGSNDGDGVDFRLSTGGTSTTNNIARFDAQYRASGFHQVGISVSNDSFAADTDTVYRAQADKTVIRATPTGTTGTASDILTVESTKITAAAPVAFPTYTRSAAGAITGAAGWQICISDSSGSGGGRPNGMMAFWDTTNSRWSYIHDNSAI